MAIHQRKQIILSFVLQFVNHLRRRVKPRVLEGSIDPTQLGIDVPLGLNGLSTISSGLSRISSQDAKQSSRRSANRVGKRRQKDPKSFRPSLRVHIPGPAGSAVSNVSGDEVQHVLSSVDEKLSPAGSAFSSIAGDNKLFLKHNSSPIFEGCSLNEAVRLLVAVQDAINILSACRTQYGDDWLLAQGLDAGLSIDDTFIANYEHMLLRLQAELVEALARKALEELLRGGHDKKQRKLLSWFTEFAEKPRTPSTSFPWTIKPSLAVLWGVCWMFYDSPGEQASKCGNDRVRQDRILQHLERQWNAPASSDYVNLGLELIGTQPQRTAQQQTANSMHASLENDLFQAQNTESWSSDLSPLEFRLPSAQVSQTGGNRPAPPRPNHSTYYRAPHQYFPSVSPDNFYSPHYQGTAAPLTAFPHIGSDNNLTNPWHAYPLPQRSPRHLLTSLSPETPSIRVTGSAGNDIFTPPQQDFASFGLYQPNRQPEASPLNLNTSFDFTNTPYNIMGASFSPDNSTMQVPQISVKHERTSSINSNTNMPTPISMSGPRSPLSPTSGEQKPLMTGPQSHSRQISEDRCSLSEDDGSRKNFSYKRAEEPPRNADNRMMCRYQECTGLLFDRKCEWSKHMDKHDRPYKCNVKGCEKLQGFTYSGGLLRHEREVHKMHGGTKRSLFCPFPNCKRSSGAGFTRKENLAEHVRRVHRRTSMSADMHGLIVRRDTMETSPIAESRVASESPYNRAMDFREEDDISLKRKRGSDSGLSDRGNEDMRAEIKRLRQENEEKDSRLRQLEQAVIALQQSGR